MGSVHRAMVLGVAVAACGGSGSKQGALGQECHPDGTCNDALMCSENTCVGAPDASVQPDAGAPLPEPGTVVNQVLGSTVQDLDLLFLVDDSHSMAQEQTALVQLFSTFTAILGQMEGGLPNLHIGVTSTDLGVGHDLVRGCSVEGPGGILQNLPASGPCEPPSDRYISDVANESGGRDQNFSGSLEDVFSCIAQLGVEGCGFEQHFAAIERALDGSVPENQGFLREEAMLGIIVLTDEDDCSATDFGVYAYSVETDTIDSVIGQLSSYRCFEFGVTCDETTDDPVADRKNPGPRTNCAPRSSSPYLADVSDFVAFLQGLKSSPGRVMFSVMGGVGEVSTELKDGTIPWVKPSCSSAYGEAFPGIRLEAAAALLGMGTTQSICSGELEPALTRIAEEIVARMSGTCLIEAAVPSSCVFNDVSGYTTAAEQIVQPLPLCAAVAEGACVTLIANSQDCANGKTEAVIDRRGTSAAPNTVVVASCPR